MAINVSLQPSSVQIQGSRMLQPGLRNSATDSGFRSALEEAFSKVEVLRSDAHHEVQRFLAEEGEDPHSMILSVQHADLAFQLFLQVRNKFTQAYQEIMRMQL